MNDTRTCPPCTGDCNPPHWRIKDESGNRYGRLLVIDAAGKGASRAQRWLCRCDCGATKAVTGTSLRTGETRSCGCLQRDIARRAGDRTRTHGQSKSSLYSIWDTMHQRCSNPKTKDFKNYGGRGISVCGAWDRFETFAVDMGPRPDGLTLERVDTNGNYEPTNCIWATPLAQARNSRSNRLLTWQGKTQCISAWAEEIGISAVTLHSRLMRGWSGEKSLSTPVARRLSHV